MVVSIHFCTIGSLLIKLRKKLCVAYRNRAAMSNLHATSKVFCSPVSCSEVSYILGTQSFLILIILNFTFLMQVFVSAVLSCLLPLQLQFKGFE